MGKGDLAGLLSVGAAATALGGAYKFSEFLVKAKRLKDVGPSNAVYVRLIKRVKEDLDEVKRLLTVPEVKDALEANPPKAKWVYGAMRDVRGALENIKPLTERVASDIEDGRRVGMRHRVYWLLSEKEKLENREKEVLVAHSSLSEVIGYLTALEPVEVQEKRKSHEHNTSETRHTKIDVDVRHRGDHQHVDEREVWVERHDRGPRRVVEERETVIEHDHAPRRVEHRDVYIERERDPRDARRYQEHETYELERRDGNHEERYFEDRYGGRPGPGRVEERDLRIHRDAADPRHVEAEYYERGPGYYDEKRYEERRFDGNLPRRPESFEDRVPDRETFMQSDYRRPSSGRYGEYAEYGAPQPSGAAEYPLPMQQSARDYEREVWIEEKEDLGYDQYGNKLPEPLERTRYPYYPRNRS